jgi:hypothetical protein
MLIIYRRSRRKEAHYFRFAVYVPVPGCNSTTFSTGDWKVPRTRGQECPRYESQLQNSVAASRQSAANLLFPSKDCGALPRRRYAGRVLKEAHVAQAFPPSRRAKAPLRRDGGQPAGLGDFPVARSCEPMFAYSRTVSSYIPPAGAATMLDSGVGPAILVS